MDLNMKSLVQFAPINFLSVSEYALWKKPVVAGINTNLRVVSHLYLAKITRLNTQKEEIRFTLGIRSFSPNASLS
jgi:hypothetical protein